MAARRFGCDAGEQCKRSCEPKGSKHHDQGKEKLVLNGIPKEKDEQEESGKRHEQAQKEIITDLGQDDGSRAGNRIIINVPAFSLPDETFGHCIHDRKQQGYPEEGAPHERSDQVLTQTKGEVNNEDGAEKIKDKAGEDGLAPQFQGKFLLD